MGDIAADETTALLQNDAESSDFEQQSYRTSLRRHSSSNLPPYHEDPTPAAEPSSTLTIWTIVPVSLLGVFVANLDGSLIIASSQQIASEFNALSSASWLVTSFVLALCASQPLYGKLSDIFGRRSNLSVSYIFFAAGCFLCGIGQEYWHVVAGRAISGIGGAGMTALVSIIIADVVPVREVASWRSYVNMAATTGRAVGGPLGGWLCDTIGWRWCFYGQVPPTILGLLLILWKLPNRTRKSAKPDEEASFRQKLGRVDMMGAVTLIATIISFLLALEFLNGDLPIAYTVVPTVLFLAFTTLFYLTESRWAKEPILPIELLTSRATLTAYLLAGLQMTAQFSLFYSVPIYFQIISGSSVGDAGLRLVPAVVGNATAGLLAGYTISKTGKYKLFTLLGNAGGCLGYLMVLLRWRGAIHPAETLYLFLGGFASGTNQSTTFIHLAASLEQSKMAIAGTTLYLCHNLFLLIGIQFSTALLHARLRISLESGLDGVKHRSKACCSTILLLTRIHPAPSNTDFPPVLTLEFYWDNKIVAGSD
ncbi:uncharacterized protein Z519_04888 [Cladophialophora bantiana CBS 173.52]|uniref:Major facilitator superfamily (MFS) profile domain-containing protein n=1 Tax=Cladophialophora bantiana (strain ATCC 10958 / CBS 173.52 / CDC B-1940 / NIH 8579) TaxID=1442370 RepID=A0A0D2IDR1_CLAB1|nr:uncharacterized protein Z519_04888 [Cladophialophora bantiana CBS 173.52]KIW94909.1 hypothetical protein Z519_04888 [Cladophialophora bantiana CBS 173.52]